MSAGRDRVDIYEAARGRWREILTHFGIPPRYLTGKPTACPLCREGRDRFVFDDKGGDGTFLCRVCRGRHGGILAGRGMELLMRYRGWDWPTALREVRAYLGLPEPRTRGGRPRGRRSVEVPWFERVWREARPVAPDGPVERYLASRGLRLPQVVRRVLREHPRLAYFEDSRVMGHWPAMVAPVVNPRGERVTVHVTYVSADGSGKAPVRAPRKILPPREPLRAVAVRLEPPDGQGRVGLAEGIETALAARWLFGVPVWAVLNTAVFKQWDPPEDVTVRRVLLLGDHDAHFAGHAALFALAQRLSRQGRVVIEGVRFPSRPGEDWNDVWCRLDPAARLARMARARGAVPEAAEGG
ncbi:MAG TPA: hypothetical protein ENK19_04265 [Acidobacteria bacterium]|nr:hypothetical protein [Acidobacteriota bacterium]